MPRLPSLEAIEQLYAERGHHHYGEGVTQIEHALQCAELALESSAAPSLTAAALLHDIGHLLADPMHDPGADARHEIVGAQALRGLFGEAVRRPIALHVVAKRYLCCRDPSYVRALSPASQESLMLQGGPLDAAQAAAFERRPGWREAVALRRFDDAGKRQAPARLAFADLTYLLRSLLIARGPGDGAQGGDA